MKLQLSIVGYYCTAKLCANDHTTTFHLVVNVNFRQYALLEYLNPEWLNPSH